MFLWSKIVISSGLGGLNGLPLPGSTRLNRFKKGVYTWVLVLAYETTPIVFPLKNYSNHNFFGLLTDLFDHFWIQVAVSLPKPAVTLL